MIQLTNIPTGFTVITASSQIVFFLENRSSLVRYKQTTLRLRAPGLGSLLL